MQIAINDCAINEFIFTLYHTGLLTVPIHSDKLTTDFLQLLVGPDLVTQFGSGMPCEVILSPTSLPQF